MGYLVVFSIMGYIFKYIITFTATYGWKVSWVWYYTGIMAMFMQFVVYDTLISFFHWAIYHRFKKLARLCQKARSMTQGYNETYDISEGEEEERMRKEEEERKKKKQEEKAAKKKPGKKKNKKKGSLFEDRADTQNGGDLFGEEPVNQENVDNGPDHVE